MGWRDRDWAKFTDDERAALFGGGSGGRSLPPVAEGAGHRPLPPARGKGVVSRRRQRIGESILIGFGVVAALVFAYDHFKHSPHVQSVSLHPVIPLVTPPPRVKAVVVRPPKNVIPIRWREQDLAPAPQAGRICVTDSRHGRICASYVVGERPADTLTRQIESMGLRVESTGSG